MFVRVVRRAILAQKAARLNPFALWGKGPADSGSEFPRDSLQVCHVYTVGN
jgi:hypothetical protein